MNADEILSNNEPGQNENILLEMQRRIEDLEKKFIDFDRLSDITPNMGNISGGNQWYGTGDPADPVTTNANGFFINSDGLDVDGTAYVVGQFVDGELKWGSESLGTLFAIAAAIAGWEITDSTIEKLITSKGIVLDSENQIIKIGNTTGNHIQIDGANERIRSSNFSDGISGFNIDGNGDAEFNNLTARGRIKTAVFQKDVISSVGGSLLILDSDSLDTDMSALDAETLTIKGDTIFSVGDILRMKDETNDEWFEVIDDSSAPTYTVNRDKASIYSTDTNPEWKKGQAVVNYGQSGAGGIIITGGGTPKITLFTHKGEPWNFISEHIVLSEDKLISSNGGIIQDHDGMLFNDAGDSLVFYDDAFKQFSTISLRTGIDSSASPLEIRSYRITSDINILSNGDFETGDFTDWTETDPDGKVSIAAIDEGYAVKFNAGAGPTTHYITQNISPMTGYGVIVKLRVKAEGGNPLLQSQIAVGYTGAYVESIGIPQNGAWRNLTFIINNPSITTIKIGAGSGVAGGTVYIDDIVVFNSGITSDSKLIIDAGVVGVAGRFYAPGLNAIDRTIKGVELSSGLLLTGSLDETVSGTLTDWAPTNIDKNTLIRMNATSAVTLNSISFNEVFGSGKILVLKNVGSADITIVDASASGTAKYKFELDSDITISPYQTAIIQYDGTLRRWICLASPEPDAATKTYVDSLLPAGATYNPTVTSITNLDSTPTVSNVFYKKVGDIVFGIGSATVDPTATGFTSFSISIPIASDFTAAKDAGGSCGRTANGTEMGLLSADVTNDVILVNFVAAVTTSHALAFQFIYVIK